MDEIEIEEKKKELKAIDKRLATIEGHISAIRKMIAEGKSSIDVITQFIAVERSVRAVSLLMLHKYLDKSVNENNDEGNAIEEIHKLLDMYLNSH